MSVFLQYLSFSIGYRVYVTLVITVSPFPVFRRPWCGPLDVNSVLIIIIIIIIFSLPAQSRRQEN